MKLTSSTRKIVLAILAILVLAGCSAQTQPNALGFRYSSGPVEGKSFEKILEPGSVEWTVNDSVVQLPLSERSYIIRKDPKADIDGVITVPASGGGKGSALLDFEVSTAFKLNTHTDDIEGFEGGTARKFYEDICRNYGCNLDGDGNTPEGWRTMLKEKYYPSLESAFKDEARGYNPDELVDNVNGVLTELQGKVGQRFLEILEGQTGGQYFCGPSFDRAQPACPPIELIIISADYNNPETRKAREAAKVAALNSQAQTELEKALQDPNYLEYLRIQAALKCAENPNGNCVLTSGNTPVSVVPQQRP